MIQQTKLCFQKMNNGKASLKINTSYENHFGANFTNLRSATSIRCRAKNMVLSSFNLAASFIYQTKQK